MPSNSRVLPLLASTVGRYDKILPGRVSGEQVCCHVVVLERDSNRRFDQGEPAHAAGLAFDALYAYLKAADFRGWEFDDLLASRAVRAVTSRSLLAQRIAIQVGERLPLNIRGVLRVPRLESTKARAFMAKGLLCRRGAGGDPSWLADARAHLSWLAEHSSTEFPGMSWGNAFDFASRAGLFPAGMPTVVWTAHTAEAFGMAWRLTGEQQYAEVVRAAGRFVSEALERHEDADGICIGYAPGRLTLVHNSNLLGAVTLLRAVQAGAPESYAEVARQAFRWSVSRMNSDGSWYYGEGPRYEWIDNFHTAYVLDCLCTAHALLGESVVSADVTERTYRYWRLTFFEDDGRPNYYHDRAYPIDIQCCSQAIETGCRVAHLFQDSAGLAERVTNWTLANMRKSNGAFRYRVGRLLRNDLESLHWGESTMLSALGHLLLLQSPNVQDLERLHG